MEDARGIGPNTAGQEHIAELRDSRIRENPLDIVLHHADAGGEDRRGRSDDGNHPKREDASIEQSMAARDHVDPRSDHRCRVNESGNWRGAFHRIRKPDVQWNLRGLAGRSKNQQQRDRSQNATVPSWVYADRIEHAAKVKRAKLADDEEHGKEEAEVSDAVDDESFFPRVGCGVFPEIEANQQVRGQADTLPADEHEQKILSQHQYRHEEHEEIEVSKEPPVPLFMSHVAHRVDVDQKANSGHDAK